MLVYIAPIIFTIKKRTGWAVFAWIAAALCLAAVGYIAATEGTLASLSWWDGYPIFLLSLIIPKKKNKSDVVINNYYTNKNAADEIVYKTVEPAVDDIVPPANHLVPPPIPQVTFHAVIDGKPEGPFTVAKINQMIRNGQIIESTLVWKQGSADWVEAVDADELQGFFSDAEIGSKNQ